MKDGTFTADRLLALYHRVSEAKDAIPRLRRFVLDLAVRGKLVEQDPSDEPAAELLKRIEKEKARLVKVGEIKAGKPSQPISDAPFPVAPNWMWVRLSELASYIQRGKSPQYATADGLPVVSQKCVQWAGLDLAVARKITVDSLKNYESVRFLRAGDLLWNSTGTGTIGRLVRLDEIPEKLVCDSHVTVVRCVFAEPEYVRIWLMSDHVYGLIEGKASGSTNQVELTAQMANAQPVPLPPLAEQQRIVAKVDELMALCDRLEAARAEREVVRDRLTAATWTRLTAPEADAETFPTHARFALQTLPTVTTRPDQIKTLRQTILNLAVRGKLAEQDPTDEPASELLKRIAKKRSAMLNADYPNPAEARTQKKKQAQQDLPAGLPLLPSGWVWATLQQASLMVIDCKNKTAPYSQTGIKLVRTTNVRHGALNSKDQKFVSESTFEAWSLRAKPEPGDILITREAPMGEVCVVPEGENICLGQRMMLARLVPNTIDPGFMLSSLRDPNLMDRVQDKPIGMTVQHLRVGGVETLLVPLPPLAEQHRIVAKLDALMALCDQLEASLTSASNTRSRLLEALLNEALHGKEAA